MAALLHLESLFHEYIAVPERGVAKIFMYAGNAQYLFQFASSIKRVEVDSWFDVKDAYLARRYLHTVWVLLIGQQILLAYQFWRSTFRKGMHEK